MKKILKRAAALLMALTILTGFMVPVNAEAATKLKKVTAKEDFEKAASIKAGKKYLVTSKAYGEVGLTYLKFKAPKKGTYVFTLQNLTEHGKSTKDVIMNGSVSLRAFQYDYETEPSSIKLTFGDDEGYSINLCSQHSWGLHSDDDLSSLNTFAPKRSVNLKMDKGNTVYVAFNFLDKCDVELNVKKK